MIGAALEPWEIPNKANLRWLPRTADLELCVVLAVQCNKNASVFPRLLQVRLNMSLVSFLLTFIGKLLTSK